MTRNYMKTATEIGSLVTEKNVAYGSSFERSGSIMSTLYPDGIQPEQMTDALAMVRVIDKMFRIATRKNAFDESPWNDIAGYGILMATLDAENREIEMYDYSTGPRIQWIDGDPQNDVVTDYNTGEDISLDDVHYTLVDPSTGEVKMSATPIVGDGETHVWQSDDGRCVDEVYFRRPPYFNGEEEEGCGDGCDDCDCYDEEWGGCDLDNLECDYCGECDCYDEECDEDYYDEYDCNCEVACSNRSITTEEEYEAIIRRLEELNAKQELNAYECAEFEDLANVAEEWENREYKSSFDKDQALEFLKSYSENVRLANRPNLNKLADFIDTFVAQKKK